MNMKRILFLSSIVALLSSCGGNYGNYQELIGSQDRVVWNPTTPFGMVFVPQGSFVMGPSDQDVPFANVSTNQRVSVGAFYMDESEITNNEYRQFVEWVQDSIIRTLMEQFQVVRKDTLRMKSKVGDTSQIIDWSTRLSDSSQYFYDSIFVKAWVDGKEVKNLN